MAVDSSLGAAGLCVHRKERVDAMSDVQSASAAVVVAHAPILTRPLTFLALRAEEGKDTSREPACKRYGGQAT